MEKMATATTKPNSGATKVVSVATMPDTGSSYMTDRRRKYGQGSLRLAGIIAGSALLSRSSALAHTTYWYSSRFGMHAFIGIIGALINT